MSITNILVATDFSAPANAALASALIVASRLNAPVHLLHVVESAVPPGLWSAEFYTPDIGDMEAAQIRDAEQRLRDDIAALDIQDVKVTSEVQLGRAASTVVEVAQYQRASLIVTGTRGRTGLPHLLLGSVAERIVRTAPCPVMTVHAARAGLHTIVAAIDFSPTSDAAVELAASLALAFDAALHLVHVVEDPFSGGAEVYVRTVLEIRDQLRQDAERRLAGYADTIPGDRTTIEVVFGTAAHGIKDIAARKDADLIVMGTHGRGAIAHFVMGSVADRVMRTAACPVLTVRGANVIPSVDFAESVATVARR